MKVPLRFKILDINRQKKEKDTQIIKKYIYHNTYTFLELKIILRLTIIFITSILFNFLLLYYSLIN
jgi:hypothetical protein